MEKLRTFYLRMTRTLAAAIAGLAITVGKDLIPFFQRTIVNIFWLELVIKLVTTSTLFFLIYMLGEFIIRQHLWKLRFFYRDIDLSGTWVGCSFYTHIEIAEDGKEKESFSKEDSTHYVKISQDCLSIKIATSEGSDYVNWGSLAAELSGDNDFRFAYEVRYSNEGKFKKRGAMGYEKMSISQRNKKGQPILLSGDFSHCADGTKPIYRGKTIFFREEFANEIKNEFIDPDFKQTIDKFKK